MAIPKIKKQTDLRENLYRTLEDIAQGGKPCLVPTKNGEVILISREKFEELVMERDLLQEFKEPLDFEKLEEASKVISRLDKKFGFKR